MCGHFGIKGWEGQRCTWARSAACGRRWFTPPFFTRPPSPFYLRTMRFTRPSGSWPIGSPAMTAHRVATHTWPWLFNTLSRSCTTFQSLDHLTYVCARSPTSNPSHRCWPPSWSMPCYTRGFFSFVCSYWPSSPKWLLHRNWCFWPKPLRQFLPFREHLKDFIASSKYIGLASVRKIATVGSMDFCLSEMLPHLFQWCGDNSFEVSHLETGLVFGDNTMWMTGMGCFHIYFSDAVTIHLRCLIWRLDWYLVAIQCEWLHLENGFAIWATSMWHRIVFAPREKEWTCADHLQCLSLHLCFCTCDVTSCVFMFCLCCALYSPYWF